MSNRMLSSAGQPVSGELAGPLVLTYLYLEPNTLADFTFKILSTSPAVQGTVYIVVNAAVDGHPTATASGWNTTEPFLKIKWNDPRASTAYYVGIYYSTAVTSPTALRSSLRSLRGLQAAAAPTHFEGAIQLGSVQDPSKLQLCPDDCAGNGVCRAGVCTGGVTPKKRSGTSSGVIIGVSVAAGFVLIGALAMAVFRSSGRKASSSSRHTHEEIKGNAAVKDNEMTTIANPASVFTDVNLGNSAPPLPTEAPPPFESSHGVPPPLPDVPPPPFTPAVNSMLSGQRD